MDILKNSFVARHENLSLDNPFEILYCASEMPRTSFSGDKHYALQFGIVLSGEYEYVFPGAVIKAGKGQIWWASCWEPHAGRSTLPNTRMAVVNVLMDSLGITDPFGEFNWLFPFVMRPGMRPQAETEDEKNIVLACGQELIRLNTERPFGWRTRVWLEIHRLILILSTSERSGGIYNETLRDSENFARISPVFMALRKYSGKPLSLEHAAKICKLSRSRFSEIFKNATGESFGNFELRSRTASAAYDLKVNHLSPQEAAEKWGFFDCSHFHRTFKKFFNCTPSEFKSSGSA